MPERRYRVISIQMIMIKISVIIPVYNTEKYIKKCISSLANQTMQEFEVVIVNDGSTDNSKEIIQDCINKKLIKNIVYLEKKNGGLSDARNYGVQHAKGKYIAFLDSDDYIDKDLFCKLEQYIDKNIDLIKFKMKTVDLDDKILEKKDGPIFKECTGTEAFEKLVTHDLFLEVACIYLYRREFFIKNDFKYQLGLYHEDFGLTPFVIACANSVVSLNIFGYNYLQTKNSIMRNNDYSKEVKKSNDVLKHYDNALKNIKKYEINEKTSALIKSYYTNAVLLKAEYLKDKEYQQYIKQLKIRKLYKNIKPTNIKQLIKRILLFINIRLYIKMR